MSTVGPNTWLQAVAERAKLPSSTIDEALVRFGIRLSPALSRPHRLTINQVRFWGQKVIQSRVTDFQFDWSIDSGIWCAASEDNLVGKSTILHVIVWGLRGEPPSGLQEDVRSWIAGFELTFSLDGERLQVSVNTTDGGLRGQLGKVTASGITELQRFSKAADFASVMNTLMLERLGLEPILSRQRRPGTEDSQTVAHGWPAYISALYIGGNHNHLLGDISMAGLPGRLLTLFAGSPWAAPLFTAKAALEQQKQEGRNQQRRTEDDRKARNESIQPLVEQLDIAIKRRDALMVADVSQQLQDSLANVTQLTTEAAKASHELSIAETNASIARQFETQARKRLIVIEEAKIAQRFFQGLSPACCPRCRHDIGDERRKQEHTDNICSICSEQLPPGEEATFVSEHTKAQEAVIAATDALTAASDAVAKAKLRRDTLQDQLAAARTVLAQANAASAGVLANREAAVIEAAKLEAVIADRRKFMAAPATTTPATEDLAALKAIAAELESCATESEGSLLSALNAHIAELGQRFGVAALERVQIDRAAHLKVWKGGTGPTNFGDLSPGERLRLRIATVIAILRIAERHGVGRHPGLILLDSPGSEEAKRQNVAELLKELETLTSELPYLQIVVASAQASLVKEVINPKRLKIASKGKFMW